MHLGPSLDQWLSRELFCHLYAKRKRKPKSVLADGIDNCAHINNYEIIVPPIWKGEIQFVNIKFMSMIFIQSSKVIL